MLTSEEILRRIQADLLKSFQKLIGTYHLDPVTTIGQTIASATTKYIDRGLEVFRDPQELDPEDTTSYTIILRMDRHHRNCNHYLYIRVDMELFNGSWLIHAVAVTCRRIPGDYRSNDTLCEDIHDVKLTIGQIQRGIRGTSQCICDKMEFLGATVFNIWCIMKWQHPELDRTTFVRRTLPALLDYERCRTVQFKEGRGCEMLINFYYKDELMTTKHLVLYSAFDKIL